jgi:hypothetical protein
MQVRVKKLVAAACSASKCDLFFLRPSVPIAIIFRYDFAMVEVEGYERKLD